MSLLDGQDAFTLTFLVHRWRRFLNDPEVWSGPHGPCWLVNLSLIAREPDDAMATMPLDTTLRLSDRAQVRILDGIVHNRSGYVNHAGPIARRWLDADPIRHEQDLLRSLIDQRPDSKGSIAPPTDRATRRL